MEQWGILYEFTQIASRGAVAAHDDERGERRAAGGDGLDCLVGELGPVFDAERGGRRVAGRDGLDRLVGQLGAELDVGRGD